MEKCKKDLKIYKKFLILLNENIEDSLSSYSKTKSKWKRLREILFELEKLLDSLNRLPTALIYSPRNQTGFLRTLFPSLANISNPTIKYPTVSIHLEYTEEKKFSLWTASFFIAL